MKHTKMNRRAFQRISAFSIIASTAGTLPKAHSDQEVLRFGGPPMQPYDSPEEWIAILREKGYNAAYCPVNASQDSSTIRAYKEAAQKADIVIAEVGAWSNPIDPDPDKRKAAYKKCVTQLALADEIEANCCVNISGSRGLHWAGPHPENLTQPTFDMIVEVTRKIIDEVKPKRTYFALETMPWGYPDSPESYLRLMKAIDREGFAVHLDPVNLVCSPQRYYKNGALIRDCFEKLGPYIKSCHAKDIKLSTNLTVHLDEICPGLGYLNYGVFLRELKRFDDVPMMMEHLPSAEEYDRAAKYIRDEAKKAGVNLPQPQKA